MTWWKRFMEAFQEFCAGPRVCGQYRSHHWHVAEYIEGPRGNSYCKQYKRVQRRLTCCRCPASRVEDVV